MSLPLQATSLCILHNTIQRLEAGNAFRLLIREPVFCKLIFSVAQQEPIFDMYLLRLMKQKTASQGRLNIFYIIKKH